jgi:hypothetical protein
MKATGPGWLPRWRIASHGRLKKNLVAESKPVLTNDFIIVGRGWRVPDLFSNQENLRVYNIGVEQGDNVFLYSTSGRRSP